MKKDIYKITNLINNKIYIGQSVNMKHRWEQHVSSSKHNPKNVIDRAIKKYGEENFSIEKIETVENYNEREKYWIQKFNSINPSIGYNVAVGGEGVGNGIESAVAKIAFQEKLNSIIDDIRNSKLNFNTIAEKDNITPGSVSEINNGRYYRQEDLEYPLRENKKTEEFYKRLIYSISHELDKSLTDIAKEYELSISYVKEINLGTSRWRNYLKYPLRASYSYRVGYKNFEKIVFDLQNSTLSQKEIAQKHNVSVNVVSQINTGKAYKKENINYPIRKNYHAYQLNTQLRCLLGGNEYIDYIKAIFSNNPPKKKNDFKQYDLKIFDDVGSMVEDIKEKDSEYGLCRNIAGYAWK